MTYINYMNQLWRSAMMSQAREKRAESIFKLGGKVYAFDSTTIPLCDADWEKIQEMFSKQREWVISQAQVTVQTVNTMLVEERKKAMNRYKEYDGCYLGHYAQWFFWLFFTIGFSVVAGGIDMLIAQNFGK